VVFDNPVADGQSESRATAVGTGCKEELENPVGVLCGNAWSVILKSDFKAILLATGVDDEVTAATCRHGILGIEEQVEEDLFWFTYVVEQVRQTLLKGI